MGILDDDIVLIVLATIVKCLCFSIWLIVSVGGHLLIHVFTNYPVVFCAGIGAYIDMIIKLTATRPEAKTSHFSSGSNAQHPETTRLTSERDSRVIEQLTAEAQQHRRKAEVVQRERDELLAACQHLRSLLAQGKAKTDLQQPQQHEQASSDLSDTAAGLEQREEVCSTSMPTTVPNVNIDHVDNFTVCVCDGSHDCGENHLIAKFQWEAELERARADALERERDQFADIYEDLNEQLSEERVGLATALREKTEAFQRSLKQSQNLEEMELRCNNFLSENRKLRRESDMKIADLEKRLQAEEKRGHEREARLIKQHEEETQKEHENVMRFVLALESKVERMVQILEAKQLEEIAHILKKEFNIRLLAVDNELNFICEASVQDRQRVSEHQVQIQHVIESMFPDDVRRQGVKWQDLQECPKDVDLKLCEPIPSVIASLFKRGQLSASGTGAPVAVSERFVPRTAIVEFSIPTNTDSDENIPNISAVLNDPTSQRVFIADSINNKIKFASLSATDKVDEVVLNEGAWAMAHLRENVLAVTGSGALTLMDITERPVVMETVFTSRYYYGIATLSEDTLVVSCCCEKEIANEARGCGGRPASVDIIQADGQLLNTVIDSHSLPGLKEPYYLCVVGRDVLISDKASNCLFRVDLSSGQLLETLTAPEIQTPCQMSADGAGNVYLACHEGMCVLMLSPDGQIKPLLTGKRHGAGGAIFPWGVSVMGQYLLVSWDDRSRHNSVVKGYLLR